MHAYANPVEEGMLYMATSWLQLLQRTTRTSYVVMGYQVVVTHK